MQKASTAMMMVNVVTLDSKPIIKRETEKAILIEIEDNMTVWMPKSQVKGFLSTAMGVWMVTTPFMVKEKGLTCRSRKATENDIADALNNGTGTWL